jgi:hypothetical protein
VSDPDGRCVDRHLPPDLPRRQSRKQTGGDRGQRVRESEFYLRGCVQHCRVRNDYLRIHPPSPERARATQLINHQSDRLPHSLILPSCLSSVVRRVLCKTPPLQKKSPRRKRVAGSDQQVRPRSSRILAAFLTPSHRYCFQTTTTEGLAAYFDTQDCSSHSPHHRYHLCSHRRSPSHR